MAARSKKRLQNATKPSPEGGPLEIRKLQFQELQLALQARALKPVQVRIQVPESKDDLVKLQVDLMQWNFDRKITAEDYALGNQALRNVGNWILPAPTAPESVDKERLVAEFVNGLPPELHNAIVAYGRKRAQEALAP